MTLSYFQSAFNDHVEIKLGLLNETYEFIGQFVAGNVTSTFGPLAALGLETGQSTTFEATWGANVKFLDGFYDKIGIVRSANPDGPVLENSLNPLGSTSRLATPGAGSSTSLATASRRPPPGTRFGCVRAPAKPMRAMSISAP